MEERGGPPAPLLLTPSEAPEAGAPARPAVRMPPAPHPVFPVSVSLRPQICYSKGLLDLFPRVPILQACLTGPSFVSCPASHTLHPPPFPFSVATAAPTQGPPHPTRLSMSSCLNHSHSAACLSFIISDLGSF